MIRKLFRWIRRSAFGRWLRILTKKIRPPGFEGLSLYEVAAFFMRGLGRGSLKTRASSMAYNFFVALFPAIIFLFTLIPFIPIHNFQAMLFETIRKTLPKNAFLAIESTITDILQRQNSKLLSVGFIVAMFFSTRGVITMMDAFNTSIHVVEKRRPWKHQLIALVLVLLITFVLLSAIALMIGTELAVDRIFHRDTTQHVLLVITQWLIIGLLFVFLIAICYRLGPAQRMHRQLISPGVLAATFLILLTSLAFAWYVNNFGRYNKLYGSIGSVIVVLLWTHYNSMMLLIGFELDAAIDAARRKNISLLEEEQIEIQREKKQMTEEK